MSRELDEAKELFSAAKDKRALDQLQIAAVPAGDSVEELREVIDLATALRDRGNWRTRRAAGQLVDFAERRVAYISDPTKIGVVATLPRCRVLASEDWKGPVEGRVDLVFTADAAFLRGARVRRLDYSTITALHLSEVSAPLAKKVIGTLGKGGVVLVSAVCWGTHGKVGQFVTPSMCITRRSR